MSSSTSSSKNDLWIVVTTVVVLAVMMFLYHLLITFKLIPEGYPESHKRNPMMVENYYLQTKVPKTVALGSSLLRNVLDQGYLLSDDIKSGIYNLCFSASSARDGIPVLKEKSAYPNTILIEVNGDPLTKKPLFFVDEILPPYKRYLLSISPIFRLSYQPISVLKRLFLPAYEVPRIVPDDAAAAFVKETVAMPLSDEKRQQLKTNLEFLHKAISEFQQHGTAVYLIQVPISKEVFESKYQRDCRELIDQYFPQSKYRWIKSNTDTEWHTSDGNHLLKNDAIVFRGDMKRQLAIFQASCKEPNNESKKKGSLADK